MRCSKQACASEERTPCGSEPTQSIREGPSGPRRAGSGETCGILTSRVYGDLVLRGPCATRHCSGSRCTGAGCHVGSLYLVLQKPVLSRHMPGGQVCVDGRRKPTPTRWHLPATNRVPDGQQFGGEPTGRVGGQRAVMGMATHRPSPLKLVPGGHPDPTRPCKHPPFGPTCVPLGQQFGGEPIGRSGGH